MEIVSDAIDIYEVIPNVGLFVDSSHMSFSLNKINTVPIEVSSSEWYGVNRVCLRHEYNAMRYQSNCPQFYIDPIWEYYYNLSHTFTIIGFPYL